MFDNFLKFSSGFLRKFFGFFIRKKHEPVVTEKIEEKISYEQDVSHDIDTAPVSEQEIPVREEIQEISEEETAPPLIKQEKRKRTKKRKTKKIPPPKTNKHGIPILTKGDNLVELFVCEKSEEKLDDDFSEIVQNSFSEENVQAMLQEKSENLFPKKELTISEKIKMYPLPEDEIDLHGYTAKEAEKKTESFIETARWKGILTLRIIVGKGLHSRGKAVLRDVVENKISELKKKNLVLTFKWEKRGKLKSGSVIVYLTESRINTSDSF
ncbi:Smr/MutS family protein [Desulfonema magnum]|uniref:Smr domain-containing protein n=1 Tax=Desulfonema magnum TaxID=45655 RepID=A0A975BP19_9BACT|nr:Smr/MutS family protein [Desulfonema magnum]QTA88802.1 Smr domain-containing protein [Desulfonema magnum]